MVLMVRESLPCRVGMRKDVAYSRYYSHTLEETEMATEAELPAGSTALVTGASSGIGESIATVLANSGCRVICAGRQTDKLEDLGQKLGSAARVLELDVTDVSSVQSLTSRLPEDWRSIDILVNNAGHDEGGRRRFDEGSAAQLASIIETNVN